MEKRLEQRVKRRLLVQLNLGPERWLGLSTDVSKHGMSLLVNNWPKSRRVKIQLDIAGRTLLMDGECRWARRKLGQAREQLLVGLRLLNPPDHYFAAVTT